MTNETQFPTLGLPDTSPDLPPPTEIGEFKILSVLGKGGMEWIDAASGNPTNRFVEYKTGGHGSEMFKAHPELQGEIVAWYEATLLGNGKPASTDNATRRNAPTTRLLVMTDDPDGAAKLLQTLQAEKAKNSSSPVLEPAFVNLLGYMPFGARSSWARRSKRGSVISN